MPNINIKTNIPFGYIAASALDSMVVDELLYGRGAVDVSSQSALDDAYERSGMEAAERGFDPSSPDWDSFCDRRIHELMDDYECDEPHIEGEYEGVTYATSWLGGALNFWIFESPVTTDKARRASPCVPGAAILDTLDGSEFGYDVPADWRAQA